MHSHKVLYFFTTFLLFLLGTNLLLTAKTLISIDQIHQQTVKRYFEQIVEDIKNNKHEKYSQNIYALVLPDYEIWFLNEFGDIGNDEEKEYDTFAGLLYSDYSIELLAKAVKEGRSGVLVEKVKKNENPLHYHNKIISRQKSKSQIYRVRLYSVYNSNFFFDLGFFTLTDNNLYSIGELRHIIK